MNNLVNNPKIPHKYSSEDSASSEKTEPDKLTRQLSLLEDGPCVRLGKGSEKEKEKCGPGAHFGGGGGIEWKGEVNIC